MSTENGIQYIRYQFQLGFEKPVSFHTFPTFIFRSILGNQLKRMACVMRGKSCDECPLNRQCSYAVIFETPVPKDNPHLAGRNRYPHPFTLYTDVPCDTRKKEINLYLTVFGPPISYFPYLFFALKQAGESGVLRERARYKISDVIVNNKSILTGPEKLDAEISPMKWIPAESGQLETPEKLEIKFISPLRLKIDGYYSKSFPYEDFLEKMRQRLLLLCNSYGNCAESLPRPDNVPPKISRNQLSWADYPRYSARQKTSLRLGGVVGTMEVEGKFSPLEKSILTGTAIFHGGKSTAFGFGKIEFQFHK